MATDDKPLYVVRLELAAHTVTVGGRKIHFPGSDGYYSKDTTRPVAKEKATWLTHRQANVVEGKMKRYGYVATTEGKE